MLKKWEKLPKFMQCDEVRPYYDSLNKKRVSLFFKRVFDIIVGCLLFVILLVPMIIIAILIKFDSKGPIFYRQERVTQYGKKFRIHKFRTMVGNADKIGATVTVENDSRVTKVGAKLRECRLDELPQLIDVIAGNMSFVGTRPEVTKYVEKYTNEMYATLLLPAGITSEASIRYKDEASLLNNSDNVDEIYIEKVLPGKMKYNFYYIMQYDFLNDVLIMLNTVKEVV